MSRAVGVKTLHAVLGFFMNEQNLALAWHPSQSEWQKALNSRRIVLILITLHE
jgi:hypothetical protein